MCDACCAVGGGGGGQGNLGGWGLGVPLIEKLPLFLPLHLNITIPNTRSGLSTEAPGRI
jgi:hypothetical protein